MDDAGGPAGAVLQDMLPHLDNIQLGLLRASLERRLQAGGEAPPEGDGSGLLKSFIDTKRLEGRSDKTLEYYGSTVANMLAKVRKDPRRITTDDLRSYMTAYQEVNGCSKVTLNNVRRIFSTFFTWLEAEGALLRSPTRRLKKIKEPQVVKRTYPDDFMVRLRDHCSGSVRERAMIDMLSSTGIRVGELVGLDKDQIDFERRECLVRGKGDKQRRVWFDASTEIHLREYLASRTDDNPALFVTKARPHDRLQIGGIEGMLRKIGRELGVEKVNPHKFRRTLATTALERGMPIEQVKDLLGHVNISTTLLYAQVREDNVRVSHKKLIG